MKNKKIISLTILAVVLVAVGILGLSKLFETSWQNENTVDNSLDAEIIDDGASTFNYPYVNYTQLSDEEKQIYCYSFLEEYILPENEKLTYQEVVNKTGEAIKYLTGYTEHQKKPMVIELSSVNMFTLSRLPDENCYICNQIVETDSGELSIKAIIDLAGNFWYIGYETADVKLGSYGHKTTPPKNISQQLVDTTLQFLQEIGVTDKIVGYEVKMTSASKDDLNDCLYIVALRTEDSKTLLFTLNKEYGLIYFSRYQTELSFNYIPLE